MHPINSALLQVFLTAVERIDFTHFLTARITYFRIIIHLKLADLEIPEILEKLDLESKWFLEAVSRMLDPKGMPKVV